MSNIKVYLRQWNQANQRKSDTRPDWFSYEKCYQSIKKGNIDLTIILDGTKENHHFQFDPSDKIVEINGGSDAASLLECLRYIEKQDLKDDDIVYIVEDDHLHREGWDIVLKEAFDTAAHYVTLYDHPDKYFLRGYEGLKSQILQTKSCHWRTTPSTDRDWET